MKKWMKWVAVAAVFGTLIVAQPRTSLSANLSGGTYTYILEGEEVTFPFDPIVRKDGLLLPVEVFQQFGIKVDSALTKEASLSKGDVRIQVPLGATAVTVNGVVDTVSTPAMRVNGRLFYPADLLREFGVEYTQDGNYVTLRNFVANLAAAQPMGEGEFAAAKNARTITATVKSDSGAYVQTEFTLLNEQLINASNLGLSYGSRARLLGLLKSNTLVLAHMTNYSNKAGGLVTSGFYLVDELRGQYDPQSVLDIGQGLVTGKLAPNAERSSVLVYPKLNEKAGVITLFSDANGASVGTWVNP